MADVDLTSQFQTRQDGLNVETTTGLVALLNSVAGVQIVENPDLNRNLQQSAVGVTSAFQPLDCTPAAQMPSVPDTQPGSGGELEPGTPDTPGDSGLFEIDSTPAAGGTVSVEARPGGAETLTLVRDKLVLLGSAFNELVSTLDAGLSARPALARAPTKGAPKCHRYQNTEHGPLGLFRSRELLIVTASGTLEFLGGVEQANASAKYIMYLEYGVNTFLTGKPAWVIDPATKQPVFDNKVVLTAQQGCTGGQPSGNIPSCGTDTVVDTMRVVVNFKKVFVGSVTAGVSTPTFSGNFQASLASLSEQSFTGVVSFTHRIPPAQP